MASDCWRVLFTCIGTWYEAPPTRLERTSMFGLTFSTAWVKTSIGSDVRDLLLDDVQGLVEDPLGDALLAAPHHAVDELAGQDRPVLGIRGKRLSTGGDTTHGRFQGLGIREYSGSGNQDPASESF